MQSARVARVGKLLGGRNPAPLGTDDSARQCHSDCADNTLLQEMDKKEQGGLKFPYLQR